MKLGDFLKQLRVERGLSLRVVAERLGVNHNAVDQWEKGTNRPSSVNLVRICTFYGVDMASFTEEGSPVRFDIVDDPDELALLVLWRGLNAERKKFFLEMLGGRPPVNDDAPKRRRQKNDL